MWGHSMPISVSMGDWMLIYMPLYIQASINICSLQFSKASHSVGQVPQGHSTTQNNPEGTESIII